MRLLPISQLLTCRIAAAPAAGAEEFVSEPDALNRRFIRAD